MKNIDKNTLKAIYKPKSKDQPRPRRQWRNPMMRSFHGETLIVDLYLEPNGRIRPYERWVPLNESALRDIGYIEAIDYKTGFWYAFAKVFIRFHGFDKHPCYRKVKYINEANGEIIEDYVLVETKETATTLYSWLVSNATDKFLKGMVVREMSAKSRNQLLTILFVLIGAGLGIWIVMKGM